MNSVQKAHNQPLSAWRDAIELAISFPIAQYEEGPPSIRDISPKWKQWLRRLIDKIPYPYLSSIPDYDECGCGSGLSYYRIRIGHLNGYRWFPKIDNPEDVAACLEWEKAHPRTMGGILNWIKKWDTQAPTPEIT